MKNTVQKRIRFLEENKEKLVIDADTHISDTENLPSEILKKHISSPDYYQGRPINAEDLLAEMRMADVDMCLTWQNPAATVYPGTEIKNFTALLAANRYIATIAEKYPEKFIPAGWTDPKALGMEKALELIAICVKDFHFPVVKLNPAQNAYPIESEEVIKATRKIISLGAVPAYHFGADTPYTTVAGLEKLAQTFSDSPLIAVHMGGGGASYIEADQQYIETRALGLKYPNLKFVLSAKRDTHIESDLINYQMAGQPYSQNLFCASDAPYGRQTWNFGGFRWMFKSLIEDASHHTDPRLKKQPGLFNQLAVRGYMGRNFAELIISAYKNIE